jgi:lipid II:glycine glycyltransferase (peptidoglycan interpeptide bridge formation enzyme)
LDRVTVREVGPAERDVWDERVQTLDRVHPFNAYDWGRVRQVDGWTPVHLLAERGGVVRGALLLLAKRLPLLPYSIFYGPHGPVCAPDDVDTVRALHDKVREIAARERAIFIRIDPNIREEESAPLERLLASVGYVHLEQRWNSWNSPRDEYRINLQAYATVDDLHNALDRDTRRCIRKGPKDGLSIEPAASGADLRAFYDVFRDFSVSKRFMARGFEYQKQLWESYVARGRGRLFLAKFEGRVIGGLLCIMFGRKCVAMHMGTPYRYQKLQSYYAYVWESIRWAKENGCEWYSFRGVGTTPTQEAFKRKFNPRVVALAGYFDYAFRPWLYRLFHWCEFTLLPTVWPLLVGTRKLANGVLTKLSGQPAA